MILRFSEIYLLDALRRRLSNAADISRIRRGLQSSTSPMAVSTNKRSLSASESESDAWARSLKVVDVGLVGKNDPWRCVMLTQWRTAPEVSMPRGSGLCPGIWRFVITQYQQMKHGSDHRPWHRKMIAQSNDEQIGITSKWVDRFVPTSDFIQPPLLLNFGVENRTIYCSQCWTIKLQSSTVKSLQTFDVVEFRVIH